MKLTIGIKVFNEERHIATVLENALIAATSLNGEVVLADSGSSDRTIAIAKSFPIKIVQLANSADRSCGAGAQLAFQHSCGTYFYLLDGDMILKPDFLPAAIAFLDANTDFAAVGGTVLEMNTENPEFQIRANMAKSERHRRAGEVDRLDGGGLYRASAIMEVGFFADRNLHAFEEFELGARLQSHGWKLARIEKDAVSHYGHQEGGYKLMWRRIKAGYSSAPGEVLRAAFGKKHFGIVIKKLGHIRNGLAVIAWWLGMLVSILSPIPISTRLGFLLVLIGFPLAGLIYRRRSVTLGIYSLASWNVNAWGLINGLFKKRTSPNRKIQSIALSIQN